MELTHILEAPILETDEITFHLQFKTTTNANGSGLFRDAYSCKVKKATTTDYWDTTVEDFYVRATTDLATEDVAPTTKDFNNAVERDGQDWFVFEQDAVREDGVNLCTAYNGDQGFKCSIIRCTARRKHLTEDLDDM